MLLFLNTGGVSWYTPGNQYSRYSTVRVCVCVLWVCDDWSMYHKDFAHVNNFISESSAIEDKINECLALTGLVRTHCDVLMKGLTEYFV